MFQRLPLTALALAGALAACSKDEPKPDPVPPSKEAPAEATPTTPAATEGSSAPTEKSDAPAEPAPPAKGGEATEGESAKAETPEAKGEAPAADAKGEAPIADAKGEAPAADAKGDAPAGESTETAAAEPKKSSKKKSGDKAGEKAADAPAKEEKPKFTELGVEVTKAGSGTTATAGRIVTLHYKASVADAEKPFDSTYASNRPIAIDLGLTAKLQVIEGLRRGLEGLAPGTEARLKIPAELAWGEKGNPAVGVPANADIVFEVQVIDVQ